MSYTPCTQCGEDTSLKKNPCNYCSSNSCKLCHDCCSERMMAEKQEGLEEENIRLKSPSISARNVRRLSKSKNRNKRRSVQRYL